MIDITNVNMTKFIQAVYDLSEPVGMGFLHYTPAPLTEQEANDLFIYDGNIALNMDYVRGRQCKMIVHRDGNKLGIRDTWPDHSGIQLVKLLTIVGIMK